MTVGACLQANNHQLALCLRAPDSLFTTPAVLVIECRFKSGSRYQIFRSAFDERFRKLLLILPLADDLVLGSILRVRRLGSVMGKSARLGFSIVRLSMRQAGIFRPGETFGGTRRTRRLDAGPCGSGGPDRPRVRRVVGWGLRFETAPFCPLHHQGRSLWISKLSSPIWPLIMHAHIGELSPHTLWNELL